MRKDSGFSLMELMTAIAILAILAAIAIPNYIGWLPNYRLRGAARDVFSNFQKAKSTAIKRNSNCAITFNQPVGGTTFDYVVFVDADKDLEYDAGEEVITQVLWANYQSVSFDTAQGGGDGLIFMANDVGLPSIAFRSNGLTTDNAGGPGSGTVFLQNTNNRTTSIVVSPAGSIKIQ